MGKVIQGMESTVSNLGCKPSNRGVTAASPQRSSMSTYKITAGDGLAYRSDKFGRVWELSRIPGRDQNVHPQNRPMRSWELTFTYFVRSEI